jgi:hypothetical protein
MKETAYPTPTETISKSASTVARRVGLIMTYNQRETCIEAIKSLITQTLALDLIIISDDCSTDGTYEVIKNYLLQNNQHHNIKISQSEKNLGFIPHFNTVIKNNCAESDLIYYNAGDDISEMNRVEEFYREYVAKGSPRYFLGHSYVISFGSGKEEILVPPIESIKENRELCLIASAYHIGASQVFTGALFFDFGPILFDDCYEDLTLGYRALLKNAYHFVPNVLLRYRIGGLSSWQKNSLEKKRDRLKSTLTQRAVDSIQSGDFTALSTIQDCYSQYGFAHLPHRDQIDILVVSDGHSANEAYSYTVSDYFTALRGVCKTSRVTSSEYINKEINQINVHKNDLLWIVATRISATSLQKVLTKLRKLKEQKVVLDTGLAPPGATFGFSKQLFEFSKEFLTYLPMGGVHSSSTEFASQIGRVIDFGRVTYLPTLHFVDGPDPKRGAKNRGLVVTFDRSEESIAAVRAMCNAFNDRARLYLTLDRLMLEGQPTKSESATIEQPFDKIQDFSVTHDLASYDFLILLGGSAIQNHDQVRYFWGLGANHCLSTFLSSGCILSDEIDHGSSSLFVSNSESAWALVFDLILQNNVALHAIASEARRRLYFSSSIQKRIAHVISMLAAHKNVRGFFDKLLPL